MSDKLQKIEAQPLEVGAHHEAVNFFAVIARAASDPAVDPGKMRELLAMRKELEAEEAKKAYDQAMSEFQGMCPIIEKRKAVLQKNSTAVRYYFAPLDDIVRQTRDIIRQCGFSFTITAEVDQGWVKAFCHTTHFRGHTRVSEFKVPIDPEAYMSVTQRYAAALTFAKRYAFANAFGILTGDEDVDANAGEKAKKGDPEALRSALRDIWEATATIRPAGVKDWAAVNQWLWRHELLDGAKEEGLPNLPLKQVKDLLPKIKEKL